MLLVIDVSSSMQATDVPPTRLDAARDAAKRFVDELPPQYNVSLVTFAGTRRPGGRADDRPRRRSSAGLDRHAAGAAYGHRRGSFHRAGRAARRSRRARLAAAAAGRAARQRPGSPGRLAPARMVLLSDGENTVGRAPESAARAAAEAGVQISTIAYGTPTGSIDIAGERIPVPADGDTLEAMARSTDGTSYEAASGDELDEVYEDIGSSVGTRQEQREISVWFVGAALLAALAAGLGSLLWSARLP